MKVLGFSIRRQHDATHCIWVLAVLCVHIAYSQAPTPEQMRRSVWEVDTPLGTCNGVLLNNTANDGRQLLLTARHCLRDETDFVTARLSDRLLDSSDIREVSWATSDLLLLASSASLDYVLYELLDSIPAHLLPVYAGWNRGSVQPKTVIGWHSLRGQKLLTEDLHRPIYQTLPTSAEEPSPFPTNGTWRVLEWESGYTELGASGSPLFNQWGEVVGILSAGASTPEDPSNDLYARFDLMVSEIANFLGSEDGSAAHMDLHRSISRLEKLAAFDRYDELREIPQVFDVSEILTVPEGTIQGIYLPLASAARNDLLSVAIKNERGELLTEALWSTRAQLFGREHFIPLPAPLTVDSGRYEISISAGLGMGMYRVRSNGGQIYIDGQQRADNSLLVSLLVHRDAESIEAPTTGEVAVRLYPNPVEGNLFIEGSQGLQYLQVFDAKGRLQTLEATDDVQGRTIVDFHQMPAGLYLIRMPSGEVHRILHR